MQNATHSAYYIFRAQAVTGLSFANASVRAFSAELSVTLIANSGNKYLYTTHIYSPQYHSSDIKTLI